MAGLHMGSPDSTLAESGAYRNGKFLVVRRDGSVPAWPYFVLGARDPAAPRALLAYAAEAEKLGMDPKYVADIGALADQFMSYHQEHGKGDPDASLHRTDNPKVVEAMRAGKIDLA